MFYIPLVIITMSGAEHNLRSFYYLGNQDSPSTWNFKQKRRSAEATKSHLSLHDLDVPESPG